MASELIAGLGIFKSLYDSAKALKDMNDAAVRNMAVIELTEKIITAREAQSVLLDRIRELEEKVRSFETWETEKQRYHLVALAPNVMAYAVKESVGAREAPHYICANCYNAGKKSYLNQLTRGSRIDVFACNGCGERFTIHKDSGSGPSRAITDYDIFNP